MPLYEYKCPSGHRREELRSYEWRDMPVICQCGELMNRLPPLPHCMPDGMYSYAPNRGDPNQFERRLQAQKDGVPVIPKEA